jgi:DNA excision repair protein ERCC-2
MTKCVAELKEVAKFLESRTVEKVPFLGVCLSSRRNLCINPDVMNLEIRHDIDSACRKLTASWVLENAAARESGKAILGDIEDIPVCNYYRNFQQFGLEVLPPGVYSLGELQLYGQRQGWCPYYVARYALQVFIICGLCVFFNLISFQHANVVVFNYQYLLDPKIANRVTKELDDRAGVVVFDEAHNIDNVCIEALSVSLDKEALKAAARGLRKLEANVARSAADSASRLEDEYGSLVRVGDDVCQFLCGFKTKTEYFRYYNCFFCFYALGTFCLEPN